MNDSSLQTFVGGFISIVSLYILLNDKVLSKPKLPSFQDIQKEMNSNGNGNEIKIPIPIPIENDLYRNEMDMTKHADRDYYLSKVMEEMMPSNTYENNYREANFGFDNPVYNSNFVGRTDVANHYYNTTNLVTHENKSNDPMNLNRFNYKENPHKIKVDYDYYNTGLMHDKEGVMAYEPEGNASKLKFIN